MWSLVQMHVDRMWSLVQMYVNKMWSPWQFLSTPRVVDQAGCESSEGHQVYYSTQEVSTSSSSNNLTNNEHPIDSNHTSPDNIAAEHRSSSPKDGGGAASSSSGPAAPTLGHEHFLYSMTRRPFSRSSLKTRTAQISALYCDKIVILNPDLG